MLSLLIGRGGSEVETVSNGITFIPRFEKIGQLVHKPASTPCKKGKRAKSRVYEARSL
jgi:hypothetical protein